MLTTIFAPVALTVSTPTVHNTISYAAYIKGADADAEPHTELAYMLGLLFEGSFSQEVIAQTLREVQPQVQLVEMEEEELLREDYPILSESDLDAVELRALELSTQAACSAH